MNDREKISRLIGAAISECSSSRFEEVRAMLSRAMRRLGEVSEDRSKGIPSPPGQSFVGMTREQRDAAIRAIDEMIEGERSKGPAEDDGMFLAG